jgi:3-phosphoshikimate 1-carboxyvinyltransferase
LADGRSEIRGYSTGGDCASTVRCLRALGVTIEEVGRDTGGLQLSITGRGLGGLQVPSGVLDAGNSGTTIRMLAGILSAHPFSTTMTGDESLQRRPMRRVIVPLERMGARIGSQDGRPPLSIQGTASIQPIEFSPEVPSAQVKTAVLLAGLHANGTTTVHEPLATRDHTERALHAFGVRVEAGGRSVSVKGRQRLTAQALEVPGDISSAAFWMVAAASLPGSEIVIEEVGLNPTRTGILDILRRLGANIDVTPTSGGDAGEPIGMIVVRHNGLRQTEVRPGTNWSEEKLIRLRCRTRDIREDSHCNQQRNAISDTALGDLFAQPH